MSTTTDNWFGPATSGVWAASSAGLGGAPGSSSNTVSMPNQPASVSNAAPLKSEYGPAPFDEASTGDCLVKSSDGVKFKLHRVVLQIASSVWRDVFDMPQPASNGEARDLPILELSEPSTTLLHLFRLLYPIAKQQIPEFDLALKLVEAYERYDIDLSSLAPYLASLLSESSLQEKPVEAYGLAWRLKVGDTVTMASRYLHQITLESRETRDQIVRYSGDVGSLLALHDLKHRRELALDNFMTALPISLYRCQAHVNLSAAETRQLRINARKALGTAKPHCSDVVQFLGLREVFNYYTNLPTTRPFSFGNPNPAVQVPQAPQSTQKSLTPTCNPCENAFNFLKFDYGCGLVNAAIGVFPQAVTWPPAN